MTPDQSVEALALALSELEKHAIDMVSQEQDVHEGGCLWCSTMILLSRLRNFGGQLRTAQLQAHSRG